MNVTTKGYGGKRNGITRQEYYELRETDGARREFIHDIPHSGTLSEGFRLADDSIIFEKIDFGMATYSHMTANEYREAQAWRPHKVTERAWGA